MLVIKDVQVTVEGRAFRLKALFDSGSSFTVMGYEKLRDVFGEARVKPLTKPREAALLNGQKIIIDGYVDAQILADEHLIEDRIYLTKNMVKEVTLEGERRALPDPISEPQPLKHGGSNSTSRKEE
jgi:hypothetical protein